MSEDNPDNPTPPAPVEPVIAEEKPHLEVAIIEDSTQFEVGIANHLGDAPLIVFLKEGRPSHAIAFSGEAGEKFLLSALALVDFLHGVTPESTFVASESQNKKKTTLH